MKNLTNYVALASVPRVNVSIDLSANNVTRNVTSQATTAADLAERNRFMVGVITCFSVLLACVFAYVIYNHIKRVKEWNKEQKAKLQIKVDENEPVLSKKTSVIAQGQKQLVIERKPSVNSRRVSQGSGGSSSSHPLLKKVRSLNDQQDSSLLNNCDLLPTCKSDNFLSSKYRGCTRGPQEYRHVNSYLDNVLIRYNSLSRQSKEVSDIEEFSDSNENSDDEDKLYKQEEEDEVEEQDSFHDVPHPYLESNDYTSISFPVHSNLKEV